MRAKRMNGPDDSVRGFAAPAGQPKCDLPGGGCGIGRLPRVSRSLVAVSLAGCLVLALTGLATGGPADDPLTMWGQIGGRVPDGLVAQLLASSSATPPLTAPVTIRTTEGATFYSVDWPAGSALALLGQTASLSFLSMGTPTGAALSIPPATAWPFQVHLLDGRPTLPACTIAVARAELTSGAEPGYVFIAVIVRTDGRTVPGRISWRPWGRPPVVAAPLVSSGVSVSRLTTSGPKGDDRPSVWQVDWIATDPREPRLLRRVSLADLVQVSEDRLGDGPKLPKTPPVEARPDGFMVHAGDLEVSSGSWLSLELQTTLNTQSQIRSELASWSITSTPISTGSSGVRLSLRDVEVVGLSAHQAWVSASFEFDEPRTLRRLTVSPPPGGSTPGSWMLRRLVRYVDYTRRGSY